MTPLHGWPLAGGVASLIGAVVVSVVVFCPATVVRVPDLVPNLVPARRKNATLDFSASPFVFILNFSTLIRASNKKQKNKKWHRKF